MQMGRNLWSFGSSIGSFSLERMSLALNEALLLSLFGGTVLDK
jgi:hypothetical protein